MNYYKLLKVTEDMLYVGLQFLIYGDRKYRHYTIIDMDENDNYVKCKTESLEGSSISCSTEELSKEEILTHGITNRDLLKPSEERDGFDGGTLSETTIKCELIRGKYGKQKIRMKSSFTGLSNDTEQAVVPINTLVVGDVFWYEMDNEIYIVLSTHFEDGYLLAQSLPAMRYNETKIITQDNPTVLRIQSSENTMKKIQEAVVFPDPFVHLKEGEESSHPYFMPLEKIDIKNVCELVTNSQEFRKFKERLCSRNIYGKKVTDVIFYPFDLSFWVEGYLSSENSLKKLCDFEFDGDVVSEFEVASSLRNKILYRKIPMLSVVESSPIELLEEYKVYKNFNGKLCLKRECDRNEPDLVSIVQWMKMQMIGPRLYMYDLQSLEFKKELLLAALESEAFLKYRILLGIYG